MNSKNPRRTVVSSGPGPERKSDLPKLLRQFERQLDKYINDGRNNKPIGITVAEIAAIKSSLETKVLPKLRSLESIIPPINRLPKDVFVRIPRFFTRKKEGLDDTHFPMNGPLITMTHVCRSWRNSLLSTPSLWTQLDFSTPNSEQAVCFLGRSGGSTPLDTYQLLESENDVEPFLSITLSNIHRLQRLEIASFLFYLEPVLARFRESAPELKHLEIANEIDITDREMNIQDKFCGGRLPKLLSLTLHHLRTDLRAYSFPSLTRFCFTAIKMSPNHLTSFFERCPSLEFIKISLCLPRRPAAPPKKRVRLAALKELRFDQSASGCGLLDHLILPECTEMFLMGNFTGVEFNDHGSPAARIHPSSINHLPVTREITKAVAMPNSCILSGPGGNLRFWCFEGTRDNFDAGFFTSFSPISVSGIRELWVGQRSKISSCSSRRPWKQTAAGVHGAFGVLTKVEDLTIVNCETEPFFSALEPTADDGVLLPGLWKLTIYVGRGDLDASVLVRCAKTRKEHSRPLGKVIVVFEKEPEDDLVKGVELLRVFVGNLICCIGETPKMLWDGGE